jgi:zinc protease
VKHLLLLILLSLGCTGSRYPRGASAFDAAKGPVKLVHQPDAGPLVHLEILVRAGSAHDLIGSEGLANLTARLLREGGAGKRTPAEVEQALYRMGTEIEVVVDREMVAFRATCVAEDAPAVAKLMGQMLMVPRLDPKVLSRIRSEALSHLQQGIVQNDEALGDALLDARLYAGHGYGHPIQGRVGVLPTLSEAQVRRFLLERYVRPAMVLGVAGAASEETVAALREKLGGAPAALYRDVTPRAAAVPRGRRVLIVEKRTSATGVHFGHTTRLRRDHPDWAAMMLATTALGEHRQAHGRLYQALRESRGLNYGDYAYVERYRQDGWSHRQQTGTGRVDNSFYVWIRPVEPGNAAFALKAAIGLVEAWADTGLSPDEFAAMQTYLQSRVALWAADPARRLGWATEAALMGWPDPVQALPAAIAGLSLTQVNLAIQRHIHPDRMDIVVVTQDAKALSELLRSEAPTPMVGAAGSSDEDEAQAAEDAQISATQLKLQGIEVVPTEDLFR